MTWVSEAANVTARTAAPLMRTWGDARMSERKRVALVGGAGSWGRHYTRAYAAHPDCEIVALVEKAKARGERFAAHYGIDRVFASVEELLLEEVPDIVSAILPVKYIHEVVTACAEAGVKVVSCEKPIDYQLSRALTRPCRPVSTTGPFSVVAPPCGCRPTPSRPQPGFRREISARSPAL